MSFWDNVKKRYLSRKFLKAFEIYREYGYQGDIERVVEKGGNVNARFSNGETALHRCGVDFDLVKYLVQHGADVNAADNDGSTPLHGYRHYNSIKYLIQNGADVNAVDNEGRTPLHEVMSGFGWGIDFPSSNDPNNRWYQNKLWYISQLKGIIALYLENGANLYKKDSFGKAPIDEAKNIGLLEHLPFIRDSIEKEEYLKLSKEEICKRLIAPNGLNEARHVFNGNFEELVKCMDYNTAMRAFVHIFKELSEPEKEAYTQATKSLKENNQTPDGQMTAAIQKPQKER